MADENTDDDIDFVVDFPSPVPAREEVDDRDGATRYSPPIESVNSQPVVILLGWMDCDDRYLAKYSNIYAKECVTIRYCTQMHQVTDGRARNTALKLLELICDMDFDSNLLIFHVFSNGGGMLYRELSRIICQHSGYKHLRVCGTVFDSCPSQPKLQSIARYYARKTVNHHILQKLAYYISLLVLYVLLWLRKSGVLRSRDRMFPILSYYDDMKYDALRCPQLFLYSLSDRLVDYRMIESVMKKRKKLGINLTYKKWAESPHVQHLRMHPDEYIRTCLQFIMYCTRNFSSTQFNSMIDSQLLREIPVESNCQFPDRVENRNVNE